MRRRWGCTSEPPAARSGAAGTRDAPGYVSLGSPPRSTRSRWRSARGAGGRGAGARRMNVRIPGLLLSYTDGAKNVELAVAAAAPTLADALEALNERYPGIRFRIVDEQGAIRAHIKIFVDGVLARALATTVHPDGELMIVGALTGG